MKVVDTFIFFNELELLDIRLNVLKDKVDYFVLVESTVSFTGKIKPLYYEENKHLFKDFESKIIHYIVEDTPNSFEEAREMYSKETNKTKKNVLMHTLTSSNTGGEVHWMREFYQKENMRLALNTLDLQEDDLVYVSDLDEIWNPEITYPIDDWSIMKLKQQVRTGFLNLRSDEEWYGTYYSKYKNIRNASLNHLDTSSKTKHVIIDNGGWHFTYQGGSEKIKTKIENFGHQEYNNDSVKNDIEKRLVENKDVLGRNDFNFWIDEDGLPNYIKENKTKYQKYFKL